MTSGTDNDCLAVAFLRLGRWAGAADRHRSVAGALVLRRAGVFEPPVAVDPRVGQHVASRHAGTGAPRCQRRIGLVQRRVVAGCPVGRPIDDVLDQAGLARVALYCYYLPLAPRPFAHLYGSGSAVGNT